MALILPDFNFQILINSIFMQGRVESSGDPLDVELIMFCFDFLCSSTLDYFEVVYIFGFI